MASKRLRWVLLVASMAVIAALVAWWALPRLVAALPGRVRHYIPELIVEQVTTPLPTALPAPATPLPGALELALATREPTQVPITVLTPTSSSLSAPTPTPSRLITVEPSHTPSSTSLLAPTTIPLPPYGYIEGLPIIPQKFNNCGPTNLTIVLNYYGLEVDQFDVAAVARPNYEDRNVSPGELVSFVNKQTQLRAENFAGGSIDLLRRLIAGGFPVIIEKGLEPDPATGWMGHYLTILGYDDITAHFQVRDTYLGPWRADGLVSYSDTERYWQQFNNTFIVVFPPEREPVMREILGPAFADPATMWAAAADQARMTVTLAPEDAFAWFNLGTSLVELARVGDSSAYAGAAAAYDQARTLGLPPRMLWYQFGPYEAYLATGRVADVLELTDATLDNQGGRNVEETYWYLGQALALTGDAAAAAGAFRKVVDLNANSAVGIAAQSALGGG